ncbi:MAG: PorT family protein [Bacteroidaceae bacterium]|nr:PorT family protein [Bacteroidaceae bacterium]
MKKIYLVILVLFIAGAATAQQKNEINDTDKNLKWVAQRGWHISLSAGCNIGGTSPLPLPREIRSINGYNPGLNLSLEGSIQKTFEQSRWGVKMGVRFERKGMTTKADTKNYHMEAWNTDGSGKVVGAWTGKVKTKVNNSYLTIPLLATYMLNKRITFAAGPYVSYLLEGEFSGQAYDGYIRDQNPTGEYADVTRAEYDFSSDILKWQWGVQAGCEYRAYRHLAIFANLHWGANSIFPDDFGSVTFALYPIYGTLGFTYLF